MLTCTSCRNQIAAYLDDLLAPRQRAEVAAHLEQCEACNRYHKSEQALRFAVRDLRQTAPPPELRGRIRAAIYTEKQQTQSSGPNWLSLLTGRSSGLVWAGGLSVAACGLLFLVQNHPETQHVASVVAQDTPAAAHPAKVSAVVPQARPHVASAREPHPGLASSPRPVVIAASPAPVPHEVRRHHSHPELAPTSAQAPVKASAPKPQVAAPVREALTKPAVTNPVPAATKVAPHIAVPVATERSVTPDAQPATTDAGTFLASATWVETAPVTKVDGGAGPDAFRASPNGGEPTGVAPRTIKLKFTPARDVKGAQLRAILPKSEDGKAAGAEEVVWEGDLTAGSPIAINWDQQVNSARANVTVTLVLEQVGADGKITVVQSQQVLVTAPATVPATEDPK